MIPKGDKPFEMIHVDHIDATGSPQANGQVEIVNKTLGPILGKLSDHESGKEWPKVVADVEFAINNTVHASTGEKPSKLLFGLCQRGTFNDYVREFMENEINVSDRNLIALRTKADTKLQKAQDRYADNANKKRKDAHEYQLGDYVILRNFDSTKGISTKVIPLFKGPYEVIKVLRNDRYVVADIEGFQVTQRRYEGVWEPKNMRLWHPST